MTEDSSTLDKWLVQQLPAVLLYSASLVSAGVWTSCKWRCQAILAQLRQQVNDAEDYRLTIPHIILTWSYGMSGMSGMSGMNFEEHCSRLLRNALFAQTAAMQFRSRPSASWQLVAIINHAVGHVKVRRWTPAWEPSPGGGSRSFNFNIFQVSDALAFSPWHRGADQDWRRICSSSSIAGFAEASGSREKAVKVLQSFCKLVSHGRRMYCSRHIYVYVFIFSPIRY